MKRLLLSGLLMWTLSLVPQSGPEPLYVSNITAKPDGCLAGSTTIEITASGGQPFADGTYTYSLGVGGLELQVAKKGVFQNRVGSNTFVVTDAAKNSVFVFTNQNASATTSVSMDILSLPLGDGNGCIKFNVIKSPGSNAGSVIYSLRDTNSQVPIFKIVNAQPFDVIFPFVSTAFLSAVISVTNDCQLGSTSQFDFIFPFPKGNANAIKTFLFNNYCSCSPSSNPSIATA